MKKKKSQQVVFKPYTMGQLQLPTDLEDLIPENHLVRVVHEAIEKMDLGPLMKRYKGGGTDLPPLFGPQSKLDSPAPGVHK